PAMRASNSCYTLHWRPEGGSTVDRSVIFRKLFIRYPPDAYKAPKNQQPTTFATKATITSAAATPSRCCSS
ncbi:MAG: hypothetical protein ACRYGR_08220, partial [Janthinobacterium lividum]